MKDESYVVISEAPKINYLKDYAALPQNYGSKEYFSREDVKAIKETVYKNLDDLNNKINFVEKMKGKGILIKPNLVSVYHKMGFKEDDYPESTDPRVFDCIVAYFKRISENVVIIESSGKGMPTNVSFKVSGIDRVAQHYNVKCIALENEPVIRYMLPKAEVMKEVYIPQIMKSVIDGNAFYVSVPKMKTNLYTGVTLGFKNAMGIIPYNLRQRNHNYNINKKLVDLLYLFKPNLTIIDGIIGGEGCTPAPVDPVDMRVIISGNNSVETDRVATRMMGVDPEENKLMVEAVKRGFNDNKVNIIGTEKVVHFRKAEASLMDDDFKKNFPNVKVLVGHMLNNAPVINDVDNVTPDTVRIIEKACDGGCLAATKTSFEIMRYVKNLDRNFELVVIIGSGVKVGDKTYYFDRDGKAYEIEDIKNMKIKRLTIGECTKRLKPFCEYNGKGCCSPSSCMLMPFKAVGEKFPLLSFKNKYVIELIIETLRTYFIKRKLIKAGQWVDCKEEAIDKIYEIPELKQEQKEIDYIEWPLPELTKELRKQKLKEIRLSL
ncbi:hypothetical protein AGR56_13365 [Clostridium sp. DMHC 10]|uniref:DUF362 domain-containing protein n=1 Tax=Clostridium sp. DMHC 10 TaxID=747377 RepID=UPI00069D3C68|nr:DUF362 domain-containing protein [Clostridium sp. DMHC 10]KOF57394.1 hypothetical protein AGR56_13365 [Clostridium sp. DMHC 10]